MPITGPKFQTPTAIGELVDENRKLTTPAVAYLSSVQQTVYNMSRSGPSASRPTALLDGRFIGMPYFDTDLGYEINLKTATPTSSSDVWVRWDGTPV